MKTLLHTCCGPCASACVPGLKEMDCGVTMLFANSNIDTREEFDKRFHEAEKLAKEDGVRLVALPYDHAEWLREVAAGYESEPEKGARSFKLVSPAPCSRSLTTASRRRVTDYSI